MKKVFIIFFIITITAASFSGCGKSQQKDIEKRAIILSAGYDLSKEGKFIVTMQAIKPQTRTERGGAAATQTPSDVIIHSSTGRTVNEAFDEVSGVLGKQPYFSHEKFIIIGESLARKGIELVLDSCLRGRETRPNVPIYVCKENAYDYIKTRGLDEAIPSEEIINIMELQAQKGFTFLTSPVEMYNSISQNSYNITGVVSFERKKAGDVPSDIFNISGSAIFKKDKLLGFLDKQETKTLALIKNKVKTGDFTLQVPESPNDIISLEIADAKCKTIPVINDNNISMLLIIKVKSNIAETNYKVNLKKNPDVIHKIEQLENEEIKKQIQALIYKLQKEYKMDVLGFGEALNKNYPKLWKNNKEKWNDVFSEIKVDIQVESHIELTGSITKPAY